jgi:hypothetical protein
LRKFYKFIGFTFAIAITLQAVPAQAEDKTWGFCMNTIQDKRTGKTLTVSTTNVFRSDNYPRYREDFEKIGQGLIESVGVLSKVMQCSTDFHSEEMAIEVRDEYVSYWEQEGQKPIIYDMPPKWASEMH